MNRVLEIGADVFASAVALGGGFVGVELRDAMRITQATFRFD